MKNLSDLTAGEIFTSLVAIGGVLTLLYAKVWPFIRKVVQLVNDLVGEDPRPGLPEGRPGVLARIDRIESRMATVEVRVGDIHHEVSPNGGGSIKDIVTRTEGIATRAERNTAELAAHAAEGELP